MMDVSVILVNHNTRSLCRQAIDALRRTTHQESMEILVVDNSTAPSEFFPDDEPGIHVFAGVENRGFGHACNIGAKEAKGRYLLFLNSDTVLDDGALDRAVEYLENSGRRVGAVGIKTVRPDGSFDHGCMRGFPTPLRSLFYFAKLDRLFPNSRTLGGYRLTYLNPEQNHEVDAVSGAFLLIPRKVFEEVGGFDETFFMYGEDLDLCYRIKEQGYRVLYFAGGSMLHLKGQSGLTSKNPVVLRHFYGAMNIFYDKHYRKKYGPFVSTFIHGAIRAKYHMALRGRKDGN